MTRSNLGAGKLLAGRVGGIAGSLALGQLLIGLTYVFAARSMGPASLGLIATCFAIGTVTSTVFDLGLTSYLVREIANGATSMSRARSLVKAKRRAVPLVIAPCLVASLLIIPNPAEGIVLGLVGWVVWEAQTANSLLRALEMFSKAASAQLAGRAIGLGTTVAFLLTGAPEMALALGLTLSFAAEALLARVFLRSNRCRPAAVADMVVIHRRSLSFGLVSLAAIGQQLDTPLVTLGGGVAAGGIYAAAGRLLGPLLFLSSSLAQVGSPWLARAQHDPETLRAEERRISRLALVLGIGPLAAAGVGSFAIPWILGASYAGSSAAFTVLAIGAVFSTINQGMALILQNRRAEKSVGTAISIGMVMGLVVTYVLAAIGGPALAAIGFTVSQLYILGHLALSMRRTASGGSHPSGEAGAA